ncbi:DUF4145 domain-containing protein [Pantoea vagans]|uniref:DUF4145 domain-containing protein n=1 Tax=Pantoea vagans TaxID=470934 RepID=UPI0023B04BCD|nr:DUF4145 domain-containing protein [Pantoea vagans]MDE8558994.1 DUF4145 domain-containing protein [Pantoea vagans]MDE8578999.1 DUF4145 domain-containing protein [Pantoea vagans]
MKKIPSLFTSFTPNHCPAWLCPSCYNQTLRIRAGSFHFGTSAATKRIVSRVDFDHGDVTYVFSGLMECTRLGCLETIAVSGEGWCEEKVKRTGDGIELDTIDTFRAKVFIPPLPLFIEPEGCPADIKSQLNVISSLLTLNSAAAANAIRRLLEILMDVMDVPEAKKLHQRIEKGLHVFGQDSAAIHALKAIGNAGSHGNEITEKDLEEACQVLELIVKKFCHASPDLSDVVQRLKTAFTKRK